MSDFKTRNEIKDLANAKYKPLSYHWQHGIMFQANFNRYRYIYTNDIFS